MQVFADVGGKASPGGQPGTPLAEVPWTLSTFVSGWSLELPPDARNATLRVVPANASQVSARTTPRGLPK